ncbi:MAG TPA: YfiR family protein [Candidatus Acidoferrum sp.]|nr:YfiR family protein [Candidatus Acidoferrum sp.]
MTAILFLLLFAGGSVFGQTGKAQEYRAKARFLAAFPNFVEWPDTAFESQKAAFVICVLGDFPFGTSLAELTRDANIRGRRVEVRWARNAQGLRGCQILFLSRSEAPRYGQVFKAIEGASILTVGETPDFLAFGGAVDLFFDGDRLRFDVNLSAAEQAHLTISSRMLALAQHVASGTMPVRN